MPRFQKKVSVHVSVQSNQNNRNNNSTFQTEVSRAKQLGLQRQATAGYNLTLNNWLSVWITTFTLNLEFVVSRNLWYLFTQHPTLNSCSVHNPRVTIIKIENKTMTLIFVTFGRYRLHSTSCKQKTALQVMKFPNKQTKYGLFPRSARAFYKQFCTCNLCVTWNAK